MSGAGEDPKADADFLRDVRAAGVDAVLAGVEGGIERELHFARETADDLFARLGQLELAADELGEELGRFEARHPDAFLTVGRARLDTLAAKVVKRCRDARDGLHRALQAGGVSFVAGECPCSIHEEERKRTQRPLVFQKPRGRRTS